MDKINSLDEQLEDIYKKADCFYFGVGIIKNKSSIEERHPGMDCYVKSSNVTGKSRLHKFLSEQLAAIEFQGFMRVFGKQCFKAEQLEFQKIYVEVHVGELHYKADKLLKIITEYHNK